MPRLRLLFALIGMTYVNGIAQRILYRSGDLNRPDTARTVRDVRPNGRLASTVTVLYKDGRQENVSRRAIWGYQDRQKRVYRYYRGSFYLLVDVGNPVQYLQDAVVGNGVLIDVRYYSKTLDSRIRRTKRRARKDTVGL